MNVEDGRAVPILAIKKFQLALNSGVIIFDDCHNCPSFLMNVISVGLLAKEGYSFSTWKDFYDIIMNGAIIICG